MSQIFGIFRNIAKITVPLDSARFFALRPLQGYGFFHLFTSDFLTICICTKIVLKPLLQRQFHRPTIIFTLPYIRITTSITEHQCRNKTQKIKFII